MPCPFGGSAALARPGLASGQWTRWLDPVHERFAAAGPGPVPPDASNTMRTRSPATAAGQQHDSS